MTDQLESPRHRRRAPCDGASLDGVSSGSSLVDRHAAAGRRVDLLVPPAGRIVVVVPHPDDEVLAVGGLITRQRSRGREVVVVAATDGDAAYPDWPGSELARVRRREQLDALGVLGVGRTSVHRLGVPDGAVSEHVAEMVDEIVELVDADDVIVAPAAFDWHPDHEACGRAAAAVAARVGCDLLGSLFWAHHHPDHAPAVLHLAALPLTDDEVGQRWEALACHASQLRIDGRTSADPILSRDVLGLLDRPVEYYVLTDGPGRTARATG